LFNVFRGQAGKKLKEAIMFLYLVRHAEAMAKEEDPSRSLSQKGIEDIRKVAEFAKGLNIEGHQILHSGKMRALQTAQVLAENIVTDMGVLEADGLAPMDDPEIWHERISKMGYSVMLAGHLPHLAKLATLLLCSDKETSVVNFEAGSIVCMKRDNGNWSIDWIIKPGMLK
jgi:phosphohistidine phosphatase